MERTPSDKIFRAVLGEFNAPAPHQRQQVRFALHLVKVGYFRNAPGHGQPPFQKRVSSVIALPMYAQYTAHMQAFFNLRLYRGDMADKSKLRQLREAAGLSVREVARQIGESNTNVSYWERSGQIPRSDVLAPLAKVLRRLRRGVAG